MPELVLYALQSHVAEATEQHPKYPTFKFSALVTYQRSALDSAQPKNVSRLYIDAGSEREREAMVVGMLGEIEHALAQYYRTKGFELSDDAFKGSLIAQVPPKYNWFPQGSVERIRQTMH